MDRVVIHQANFLPWLPYFSMISLSENFVVLDNIQYKPRYFINRTKIFGTFKKSLSWITIPTDGTQSSISNEVIIVRNKDFFKAINKVRHNYQHSDYFEYWQSIEEVLCNEKISMLIPLNVNLLKLLSRIIGLETPTIYYSSQILKEPPVSRTDRFEKICSAINSNKILSGIGKSKEIHDINYLKSKGILFQSMNIDVIQEFSIKRGLSVIDSLLRKGPKVTRKKIKAFGRAAYGLNEES
jgi:hypothetical protein